MGSKVAGAQGHAHGHKAAFTGHFEGVRAGSDPSNANGRVRLLVGFDVAFQRVQHGIDAVDCPVFPFVFKRLLALPKLQNDVQRFPGHVPVLASHAIDVEELPVARQTARSHSEHESSLGHMVQVGHSVRQLGWIVVGKKVRAWGQLDIFGAQQGLGNEQVRSRVRLPGGGKMLADPGFMEAQLINEIQMLEIPVVARVQIPLRWVRGHHEDSNLHTSSLLSDLAKRQTLLVTQPARPLSRLFYHSSWCGARKDPGRLDCYEQHRNNTTRL